MGARISTVDTNNDTRLILGAWLSRTRGTIYQASTDGFVIATSPVDTTIIILSDDSTPPTIQRARETNDTGDFTVCCPIKKNDYWEAQGVAITSLFWLPLEVDVII